MSPTSYPLELRSSMLYVLLRIHLTASSLMSSSSSALSNKKNMKRKKKNLTLNWPISFESNQLPKKLKIITFPQKSKCFKRLQTSYIYTPKTASSSPVHGILVHFRPVFVHQSHSIYLKLNVFLLSFYGQLSKIDS